MYLTWIRFGKNGDISISGKRKVAAYDPFMLAESIRDHRDKGSIMRKACLRYDLMNYQMIQYAKTPFLLVIRVFLSAVHPSETIMYPFLTMRW